MEPNKSAEDVVAVRAIVKQVTGSDTMPFRESLMWEFHPGPQIVGVKDATEILRIGEYKDQGIYAYLWRHDSQIPPNMLTVHIILTLDKGPATINTANKLLQVSLLAPFKYIRPHDTRPLSMDAPLKAFILACFILRGHTRDVALRPRSTVNGALRQALLDVERGAARKGKGKTDVSASPNDAKRAGSSSLGQRVDSHGPKQGHYRHEIEEVLWERFGTGTLPYLDHLRWTPTTTKGAVERLKIGTRMDRPVFAFFDPKASPSNQINILQVNADGDKQPITKTMMHSIAYFKPFSYLEINSQVTMRAQKLRTFLKGCFALRGHSDGQLASIDLDSFARTAQKFADKGFSRGVDTEAGDSICVAGPSSTDITDAIKVYDFPSLRCDY